MAKHTLTVTYEVEMPDDVDFETAAGEIEGELDDVTVWIGVDPDEEDVEVTAHIPQGGINWVMGE